MKSQDHEQEHINKVWLNYYQIQETSKSDLLHKEISCSPSNPINILTHPYSCIGLLKYSNSSRGVSLNGTAFLIGSDLIVTTADNVYSKQDDCFFKDFYFYPPSFNKNQTPIKIREFRIDESYIRTQSHNELASISLALMKLDRPVYRPKYCQLKYDYSNQQGDISLYGYPKPIHGQRLYGRDGKIVKIKESIVIHSILSEPGQAGSPILVQLGGEWIVVGVHFSIANHYGIGLRFTKQLIMMLCRWQREMIISSIKVSSYNQQQSQSSQEIYSFKFQTTSAELNKEAHNWEPIWVQWQTSPQSADKFLISKNRITRKQMGYFDSRHKQVTTTNALPKQGKFTIKIKIIKYGKSSLYDSIYFGIITQKHKKNEYSDGRHRGGISYLSYPDNLKGDGSGRGTILMDGVQMAYGSDLFLQEGDEVKMEINLFTSELTFTNKRKRVTIRAGQHYNRKKLYLFTSLCSNQSCISWHSVDCPVWN